MRRARDVLQGLVPVLVAVAVGYAGVLGAAYLLQRQMVYFPDPRPPDPEVAAALGFEPVTLATADGLALVSWYAPPKSAQHPVLVYLHGNADAIGRRAPKFVPYLDAGFGALLVEYRGYAGNPGTPHEAGLYRDGEAALAWLARHGIDGPRVVAFGSSLGTGIAIELASRHALGALVLEAPFTSLAEVGARAYPWLPVRVLARDRFDSLAKMARIAAPVLVIHGEADRIVPAAMGRAILEAARGPKAGLFLPSLDHDEVSIEGAPAFVIESLRGFGVAPAAAGHGP